VFDPAAAGSGGLPGAGQSRSRSYLLHLPEGTRGAGQIQVTLTVDTLNAVREVNAAGDAETNNSSVLAFTSAAKPYADLDVTDLQAPASARGGDTSTLQWTITNIGSVDAAPQSWSDRLVLSRDTVVGNGDDVVLATVLHSGGLVAGASY